MEPKKPAEGEPPGAWRYDTLGYTFAFSILLFAGAGFLLDRWLGTAPFVTVFGTLLGAGLAFVWVYRKVRQDDRAYRADQGGKRAAGAP